LISITLELHLHLLLLCILLAEKRLELFDHLVFFKQVIAQALNLLLFLFDLTISSCAKLLTLVMLGDLVL